MQTLAARRHCERFIVVLTSKAIGLIKFCSLVCMRITGWTVVCARHSRQIPGLVALRRWKVHGPWRVWKKELATDSGGAGEFRGF